MEFDPSYAFQQNILVIVLDRPHPDYINLIVKNDDIEHFTKIPSNWWLQINFVNIIVTIARNSSVNIFNYLLCNLYLTHEYIQIIYTYSVDIEFLEYVYNSTSIPYCKNIENEIMSLPHDRIINVLNWRMNNIQLPIHPENKAKYFTRKFIDKEIINIISFLLKEKRTDLIDKYFSIVVILSKDIKLHYLKPYPMYVKDYLSHKGFRFIT